MQPGQSFFKFLLKVTAVIFVSMATVLFSVLFLFLFITVVLVTLFSAGESFQSPQTPQNYTVVYGNKESTNELLSIPVTGIILGEKYDTPDPFSLFETGIVAGYSIKRQLYKAADNSDIKGVILEINSPGGTIYGSRAIDDGIAYYKQKTSKPVIAFVAGLAASGGYWAALSADEIIADYGSTIGSIGVLTGPFKYYDEPLSEDYGAFTGGIVTQNGIETTLITAGKFKDYGNPYRKLSEEEIRLTQQAVNNEYDAFVTQVSTKRNIPEAMLRSQIGAMVYDNKTAISFHLIDDTMNKEATYETLAKKANVSEYKVIRFQTRLGLLESLLATTSDSTESVQLCTLPNYILAYHGDVTTLCQ